MTEASAVARRLLGVVALGLMTGCGDFVEYDPRYPVQTDAGAVDAAALVAACDAAGAAALPDAAAYGEVLGRRVTRDAAGFARVDYSGWAASPEDRAVLDDFVDALADVEPAALCTLALWIDAYNANVLQTVIERFDGDPGFSVSADGFAFFRERSHAVGGLTLSLDELEHGVVRGDFARAGVVGSAALEELRRHHAALLRGADVDARVHMALNCAALGCPNLRDGAYLGGDLDLRLEDATRSFLDNAVKGAGPRGISSLFDWFADDFVRHAGSVEAFIEAHRSAGTEGVDLGNFIDYDWSLNGS